MQVQPYLFFEGRCEEALEFYKKALGAKVKNLMRYGESPTPPKHLPAGSEKKVLHAEVELGRSKLFASDGHCSGATNFQGSALSMTVESEAEAEKFFAALSEGGQVRFGLAATFFSPKFGMVTDKFGVLWMVIAGKQAGS